MIKGSWQNTYDNYKHLLEKYGDEGTKLNS
jgi:hypothetical protein